MLCQLYRRLSAERHDYADRLFHGDYVVDVLRRQRLEIQSVRNVEICRYRFGVIVDDTDLVTLALYRPGAMHAGIIEFYALTYSDGSGTQYQNRLFVAVYVPVSLVLVGIGRIEIRRFGVELRSAGIDHFVYRIAVFGNLMPGNAFQSFVGISQSLARQILFVIQCFSGNRGFKVGKIFQLVYKEPVYFRDLENTVYGDSLFQSFEHGKDTPVVARRH